MLKTASVNLFAMIRPPACASSSTTPAAAQSCASGQSPWRLAALRRNWPRRLFQYPGTEGPGERRSCPGPPDRTSPARFQLLPLMFVAFACMPPGNGGRSEEITRRLARNVAERAKILELLGKQESLMNSKTVQTATKRK